MFFCIVLCLYQRSGIQGTLKSIGNDQCYRLTVVIDLVIDKISLSSPLQAADYLALVDNRVLSGN